MADGPAHWRRQRAIAVAGAAVVVLGAALGVIAEVGASPADPSLGFIALAGLVAAPGVLALFGLHHRAALWLPAGLAAVPLAFLSFAGLTLPLLPAAVVFLLAWVRHPHPHGGSLVHPGIVTPVVVSLLLMAVAALFLSDDPAAWTTPTGGGETSDIITNREALLSLTSTGLALVVGWAFTRPKTHRPAA